MMRTPKHPDCTCEYMDSIFTKCPSCEARQKKETPPKVEAPTKLWAFCCSVCGCDFWMMATDGFGPLGCIQCPDGNCGTRWLPSTMDGRYERGFIEEWKRVK